MAPFKSSLARSVGKLLGVSNQQDLSLRGATQSSRKTATFSATGGTEYSSGSYKYHVFLATSSPGFNISVLGPGEVDCLVVAGGGGGSTAGGGAGGMRVVPYTFTATGPTPITIGDGGAGGGASGGGADCNGNDSFIGPTGSRLVSATYGGGAGSADDGRPGQPGGSGGGARTTGNDPGGTTVASPDGISPTVQGYPGGAAIPYAGGNGMSGGGGGAGGAGEAGDPPAASPRKAGDGGDGAACPPNWVIPPTYGTPGPDSRRYFAGGGGGGTWGNPAGAGGFGGGGAGRAPGDGWNGSNAYPGTVNTGGGGGANAYPPYGNGGNGGPGIVIIRYQTN
jgi:hypothetical protein